MLASVTACWACAAEEPSSPELITPPGCVVIEHAPDPAVVASADWRERIVASGLPWRVRHHASGIELLLIPAGTFERGATDTDDEASADERPRHSVQVNEPFWMSRTEVTQEQWRRVMGDAPSLFRGEDHPVERIDYVRALEFASHAGLALPTESQWEYACRAGVAEPRYGALDDTAWHGGRHGGNAARTTHPVGQKQANGLGLFDLLGNVQEWTSSGFLEGEYGFLQPPIDARGRVRGAPRVVVRGGSWYDPPRRARASARYAAERDLVASHVGFRVILPSGGKASEGR